MVDINYIRDNANLIKEAAREKQIDLDVDELLMVDGQRRKMMVTIEELRHRRNEVAEKRDIEEGKKIKQQLEGLEEEFKKVDRQFLQLMAKVPTVSSSDSPRGIGEQDNVEVYRHGKIPQFDFPPKDHIELGKKLDILDLERGAKVGGYRGYYIKNEGVLLMMALMMYALNKMIQKGFKPMISPTLVKGFALFGSGYFKGLEYNPETDEIYQICSPDKESTGETSVEKKFLVGTAEPSLLAYFAGETLLEEDLPIKLCGFSQCYRSEIGSYGKETKGLYRVHEFMKVEQVIVSKADGAESDNLQQEMVNITKEIHEDLGLPYRVVQICTGDLSVGKYRQYDYEVWMPGLNRWGETGSASNFVDWQSRRLNIKYKDKSGKKKYVYLLNNTALPTPRPFIAILEHYQKADGSVVVPEVLRKYIDLAEIKPK